MYKTENALVNSMDFNVNPVYKQFRIILHVKTESGYSYNLFSGYNVGDMDARFNLMVDNDGPFKRMTVGNYLAYFFAKIFEVVDVTDIKQIKNKPVRVIVEYDVSGKNPVVVGIQNFLDTAKFFIPYWTFKETVNEDLQGILKKEEYDRYIQNHAFYNQTQNLNKKPVND